MNEINININKIKNASTSDLSHLIKILNIKHAMPIPKLNISLEIINTVEFLKSQLKDLKSTVEKPLLTQIKMSETSYALFIAIIVIVLILVIVIGISIFVCLRLKATNRTNNLITQFLSQRILKRFPSIASSINTINSIAYATNDDTNVKMNIVDTLQMQKNKNTERAVKFNKESNKAILKNNFKLNHNAKVNKYV
jgi:hypothetical protein